MGLHLALWFLLLGAVSNLSAQHTDIVLNTSVNEQNAVVLSWNFIQQYDDVNICALEKSADGKTFDVLHDVDLSALVQSYTDEFPFKGEGFYRLRVINHTDTIFSGIQPVKIHNIKSIEWNVMPNPVFNNATIIINDPAIEDLHCVLIDASGKTVRVYNFRKNTTYFQQIVDMYTVPKGIYFLRITGPTINDSKRIVKQ